MVGFHVAPSHWLILAMCWQMIGPPRLYDLPSQLPTHHAMSPIWLVWSCATCHPCSGDMCHPLTFPFEFFPIDQTLMSHNFCIQTLFEEFFALLESYCQALCIDGVFYRIWNTWILIFFGSPGTSIRVSDSLRPLWSFLKSSWINSWARIG